MHRNNTYEILAVPKPETEVELLVGEEVFNLLSDPAFQSGWDVLYNTCPWGTVFQSREFVATWYHIYKSEYLPVVVKSEEQGRLTGLLTMALPLTSLKGDSTKKAKGRIVGAGQYEAEYQAWLSNASISDSFIKGALTQIRKEFPRCDIHLRYLPSQVPLDWTRTELMWQSCLVLHSCSRPLMDMQAPDLSKIFRKSEYRNKLNRLKKLGELKFELVTEITRFSEILNELAVQYDFRQGAMFNKNQFRDNPLKAEFLLAMFRQNLLHVSLLKVNEEIVASIVAVAGKNWVHLGGINMHSPFSANYYSPGFVHFIMLGQQLAQEGVAVFDLTPGGDSYKERMATNHDQVYELVVANNTSIRIKKQLRKEIDRRLSKAGIRPMSVELLIKKRLYLLKGRTKALTNPYFLKDVLGHIKGLFKTPKLTVYRIEAEQSTSESINSNNPGDLLNFEDTRYRRTRWEFLEEAMGRFECGERAYTLCEGGRLLACAWLSPPRAAGKELEGGSARLQGLYCHPNGRERFRAFLGNVAAQVAPQTEASQVYAVVDARDSALNHILREVGYSLQNV